VSQDAAGRFLVFVSNDNTSEDDMTDRLNLFENELGLKFAKRFANASTLITQSTLPKATVELVSIRASQINGCGHCIDMHTKDAAAAGETPTRINLVATWREATVFTEAERAALAFAEEGTRLADAYDGVSDETWAWASKHYDEDQLTALVLVVSMINAANRMAVLTHTKGGSYQPGQYAGVTG
jgi:AhpD family alkylhydroperoxidase